MDRKRHTREELLSSVYRTVNGTQSGRLAARVDDLRRKGYEVESPLIRYVKGKKVFFKTKGRARMDKEFWYILKGSKTVWKQIEGEWSERMAKRRSNASKKAAKTMKQRRLLET